MGIEITLRIWHPTEDPITISNGMRLEPSLAYRVGDRRTGANGEFLPSTHKESLWTFDFPVSGHLSVAEAMEELDRFLASRSDYLRSLRANGAKTEYFLGLFLNHNRTEVLPSADLAKWAERGVDIVLSIYVPEPDHEKS